LKYYFRFWSKVHIQEGCWLWKDSLARMGYGAFSCHGESVYAHRFSYELMVGDIPDGLVVDHVCHNRACVNPAHMRLCSRGQNVKNMAMRPTNKSGFKGASFHKASGLWHARIRDNYKTVSLGYYKTPEEAHAAYCKAAPKYHGEFANFGEPS
jgi:hypothetical protein